MAALVEIMIYVAIAAALFWAGMSALLYGWLGTIVAAVALFLAHRKWRSVRVWYYLRHRGWPLPALAWAAGGGAEGAIYFLYSAVVGGDLGRLYSALIALGCAVVSAVCTYSLKAIFEGKLMKDIFDFVPADQQDGLRDFLAGGDPNAAGQSADFSKLDPAAVCENIKARVVGQDAIVDDVVSTIFRRGELARPHKPLAVLMFVGATGAGKTELARAVAATMFDGRVVEQRLNTLKSSSDSWVLIGPPPGYQGSDQGSRFCRQIGQNGTGVILLDEAEKAHPDVMQILMGLLDTGELTEQSTGTVYSARGFVVILTSNSAKDEIAEIASTQTDPVARQRAAKSALERAGWLQEELGRIDAVYPFPKLDRRGIAEVVRLMIQRHADAVGVEVVSADAALLVDLIRKQEKMADFGIRELDRLVERAVLNGLLIVKRAGHKRAAIHVRGDAITVDPVTTAATATASQTARA